MVQWSCCQGREKGRGLPSITPKGWSWGLSRWVGPGLSRLSEAAQGPWPQGAPPAAALAGSPFPGRNGRPGLREQGEESLGSVSYGPGPPSLPRPPCLDSSPRDPGSDPEPSWPAAWSSFDKLYLLTLALSPLSAAALPMVQGSWCGKCSAWGSSLMTCTTTRRWSWRSPRATGSTGPSWRGTQSTRSCTAAGTRRVIHWRERARAGRIRAGGCVTAGRSVFEAGTGVGVGVGAPATEQVEMALGPCPQVFVIWNQHCRRQQLNKQLVSAVF